MGNRRSLWHTENKEKGGETFQSNDEVENSVGKGPLWNEGLASHCGNLSIWKLLSSFFVITAWDEEIFCSDAKSLRRGLCVCVHFLKLAHFGHAYCFF